MNVQLHRLRACTLPRVGHTHREGYVSLGSHLCLIHSQIGQGEGGVTQSVTEGKERMSLLLVRPSVTHIDAFLVFLIDDVPRSLGTTLLMPCARIGIQGMSTHLLERGHPCIGQLAAGIDISHQYRSQGTASLGTYKPSLNDGRYA